MSFTCAMLVIELWVPHEDVVCSVWLILKRRSQRALFGRLGLYNSESQPGMLKSPPITREAFGYAARTFEIDLFSSCSESKDEIERL